MSNGEGHLSHGAIIRVPEDLVADLKVLADHDGLDDLTPLVRTALAQYARGRLAAGISSALNNGSDGAFHHDGQVTERIAAHAVAPRIGSWRFKLLELFDQAGVYGLTADAATVLLRERALAVGVKPPASNNIPRRVTDLLQAGMIEKMVDQDALPVTRQTQNGGQAIVWRITWAGVRTLRELRVSA